MGRGPSDTRPPGVGWIGLLQHIALEGRCWMIGNRHALRGKDIMAAFPDRRKVDPDPAARRLTL